MGFVVTGSGLGSIKLRIRNLTFGDLGSPK